MKSSLAAAKGPYRAHFANKPGATAELTVPFQVEFRNDVNDCASAATGDRHNYRGSALMTYSRGYHQSASDGVEKCHCRCRWQLVDGFCSVAQRHSSKTDRMSIKIVPAREMPMFIPLLTPRC